MNAKNFENFLHGLYSNLFYEITFTAYPIYKGVKYIIKVGGVQIGVYTEFYTEIGGAVDYQGYIAGEKKEYFCLLCRDGCRSDYNNHIPFP